MKIGISAEGPDKDAKVGDRFGISPYFLVIDLESDACDPIPVPGIRGGKGSGMQVVALALKEGVEVVLTGYCSPTAEKYLAASGITVVTGIGGVVGQAIDKFKKGAYQRLLTEHPETKSDIGWLDREMLVHAVKQSAHQFVGLLPILFGVILLTGLLNAWVSRDTLSALFTGHAAADAIFGAAAGSVLAGNPINSYVIGGELLANGVSLFAVTAFIVSWVTVGLVQLPAEMASLGKPFALLRNGIAIMIAIVIGILTPAMLNFFG